MSKDLYSQIDAECAIVFFYAKQDAYSLFYYKYDLDEERKKRQLFGQILGTK